jgi:hypothetical protein
VTEFCIIVGVLDFLVKLGPLELSNVGIVYTHLRIVFIVDVVLVVLRG